jgi:hypothetical protein
MCVTEFIDDTVCTISLHVSVHWNRLQAIHCLTYTIELGIYMDPYLLTLLLYAHMSKKVNLLNGENIVIILLKMLKLLKILLKCRHCHIRVLLWLIPIRILCFAFFSSALAFCNMLCLRSFPS